MTAALGYLAALAWFILAAATALGVLLEPGLAPINLVLAAVFIGVAAFLAWRTQALIRLRRRHPDGPEVRTVLVADAIASSGALLIGTGCATAAVYRLLFEGAPVFG